MYPTVIERRRLPAVIFLTALSLLIGFGLGATPAAAQSNHTATPEPAAGSVGPITILDYGLEEETMTLTLNVERPTAYALSDALAGLRQEGVSEVPVKQGTLSEGRQTLSLAVTVVDDAGAVTLSTPAQAVRIQTAPVGTGRSDVDYETAQAIVGGSALFGATGVFYWVKRKRDEEQKDAERIL